MTTAFLHATDFEPFSLGERPTHINGPPLCRCGRPAKSYYPRCEDCWLEATKGSRLDGMDRRPACLRFGEEVMSR